MKKWQIGEKHQTTADLLIFILMTHNDVIFYKYRGKHNTTTKNQLPILGSYARGKNSRKSSSRRLKSLSFILFNSARSFGPPYVRCAMYCLASRMEAFHTLTRSCGTTSGGIHLIDQGTTQRIFRWICHWPYLCRARILGCCSCFFAGVV